MTTHPPLAKRTLIALVALAAASALWAVFLWGQLMLIRSGGAAFCAAEGAVDCASVWDSPLASAVHGMTRVPVAGWGLMWGLMAFAVSLAALGDPDRAVARGMVTSLRLIAIAGAASVVGLLGASIADGHICTGCIGTYLVVGAWSVLAFTGTKGLGFAEPQRGVVVTGVALVVSYLTLLYPGVHTPRSMTSLGKEAMAKVGDGPAKDPKPLPPKPELTPQGPSPFDGPATGNPEIDQALEALIGELPPEARQLMSDFLLEFETAKPAAQVPQPRVVLGPSGGTRVVDWTDPLCPHCADLHAALDELRRITPGGFATEPHMFPLDGLCNSEVQRKNESGPVRCLASKALVCLEGDPDKFALGQKVIFENQAALTPERVFEVLKPFTDRKTLEACIASPDTQAKLDVDIAAGRANGLEGTPLVLFNGREIKPWPPLIYALALTGGKTKHSAFKVLPPPKNRPGPLR